VILTKQKKEKKKRIVQHWYLPLLVGPSLMFEKFFTHRTRNNFEAFHGIEGPSLKLRLGTRI
jgi:hypothetical protein